MSPTLIARSAIAALLCVLAGALWWHGGDPSERSPAGAPEQVKRRPHFEQAQVVRPGVTTEDRARLQEIPDSEQRALDSIESQIEAGHVSEARAAARRFLRAHRHSRLAGRVRALTGVHLPPGR